MNFKTFNSLVISILCIYSTALNADIWQIGVVTENSRSPFVAEQRESKPLPIVNYIGDRFSFVNGKLEYQLTSSDTVEISLIGQIRSRQFYTASIDTKDDLNIEGMRNRNSALEMGLALNSHNQWGQYVLESMFDISGTHQGFELSAKYSYPIHNGRWLIEPAIGLQLQSSDLVSYYHGVNIDETNLERPAYNGDQAINLQSSLLVGYTLNRQLLAIASIEQTELDKGITDSPVVTEQRVRKIYVGVIYTF